MSLRQKLALIDNNSAQAVLDFASYGPSFGFDDIRTYNLANTVQTKAIRNNYAGPAGEIDRNWATYLAGGT